MRTIDASKWTAKDQEKFEARCRSDESGCIIWTGANNGRGYGIRYFDGANHLAHRLAWTLANGPIPDGLTIDHLCRVRACVNPDHLEPTTYRENNLRGTSLSAQQSRRTHCPRGHALSGDNLVVASLRAGKRTCRTCMIARRARLGDVVREAATTLGMGVHDYRNTYGQSRAVAERILSVGKGQA